MQSAKERVAALETSTSKVQAESASSVPVSSLFPNPAQRAATASAPAVQCEAIVQDEWPDTDSDLGVYVPAKVGEQPTDVDLV